MIAQWIAQALIRGDDHLILSTEELAKWQSNGCRVSLLSPYGYLGPYAFRKAYEWSDALTKQLIAIEPTKWPSETTILVTHENSTTVRMPGLEFQAVDTGKWRVPLLPKDPNHCLDAWNYDLRLTDEELAALRPIAYKLATRMLIRCEIEGKHNARGNDVHWSDGRIALADLAGIPYIRLHAWFDMGKTGSNSLANNAVAIDSEDCVDIWKARQRRLGEKSHRRSVLSNPREISRTGDFVREVQIRRTQALKDSFHIKFTSRYLKSHSASERQTNFDFNLSEYELLRLKEITEQALELVEVPIPLGVDIAAMVVRNSQQGGLSLHEQAVREVLKEKPNGGGSFSQELTSENGAVIKHRFTWATGMASSHWASRYRSFFKSPVPEWVELEHPLIRSRLCQEAIHSATRLPDRKPIDSTPDHA